MGNCKPAIEQFCSRAALNRGLFIIRGSIELRLFGLQSSIG